MIIDEEEHDNSLVHYGTPRRSGRYPWGSGGDPSNTRNPTFLDHVASLKSKGMSEKDIAQGMKITQAELRARKSYENARQKQADIAMAQRLKDKGLSKVEIGKRMDKPESTIRNLLRPGEADKTTVLETTANMLKGQVAEKTYVDVGKGVENYIGVSKTRLDNALHLVRQEGYMVFPDIRVPQLGTDKETYIKTLAPPGSTWGEVQSNRHLIQPITNFSETGGRTFSKLHDPLIVNPKRVEVIYGDQGGDKADGVIYVRPGVSDLSMGGVNYAQVRIKVGKDHYLKGMAIHKEGLPEGTDLQFNTPKSNTGNKLDAMKKFDDEPDPLLPFGTLISRQITENHGTPKEKNVSAINIVNEDENWEKWSRTLSSQFLSKQSPALARTQLDMTYEERINRFNEIKAMTNNTVKRKLLEDFAGETDTASIHLKAASLPNQQVKVLLPVQSLKQTEVYSPSFLNGTPVVLIRHPHGGTFEIPRLTVNNRNREAIKLIGKEGSSAIGINHKVARALSGADFDGDTVLIIPDPGRRIKDTPALKSLMEFDPQAAYPGYPGMKTMKNTQQEMGIISNLITDMTIRKASFDEISRAVKHSMVVIDAENKGLDHKLSYNDNGIKDLKKKYQGTPDAPGKGGASTLISRARSRIDVPFRVERRASQGGKINPRTGEIEYVEIPKTSYKTGKPRTIQSKRLAETKDAFTLSSGTPIETIYANHSNKLKSLANQARLEMLRTPPIKRNESATKTFKTEVNDLNAKLARAESNAPRERQAQLIANQHMKARRVANPNMDKKTEKKLKYQTLSEARARMGASKTDIVITDNEWTAIQAGAISDSKLKRILDSADMEVVHEHATPKTKKLMTSSKTTRANQMLLQGYTRAEVAAQLGVSLSTLDAATG